MCSDAHDVSLRALESETYPAEDFTISTDPQMGTRSYE